MVKPLQNITAGEFIDNVSKQYKYRPAIETTKQTISYGRFSDETKEIASGLISLGVGRGEHVAIWSIYPTELVVEMFFAIQRIGAVACVLHSDIPSGNLPAALIQADADYLICDRFHYESNLVKSLPKRIKATVTLDCVMPDTVPVQTLIARGVSTSAREDREKQVLPGDPAVMLFTSGTTGMPKIVVTSHFSRINNGIQQASDLNATTEDRYLIALPLYHCFCLSANIYSALSVGACLCFPESRHTADIITALRERKCTILNAVPTQFKLIIENPTLGSSDDLSLRTGIIGGGGYSPKLFEQINNTLGMTLMSSLGMTECSAGVTISNFDDSLETRSTTVGHLMSHMEIRITNLDSGEPAKVGEPGEICFRGYSLMQCYYNQPELTAEIIDSDGWLHSGDFGHLDEKGNLTLDGRIKDLIIRGGENINPREVENSTLNIEGVSACKAVGVPDDHFGECIYLFVVLRPGAILSEDDIKKNLRLSLEKYKIPERVAFIDALPVNDLGKINVLELKNRALALKNNKK